MGNKYKVKSNFFGTRYFLVDEATGKKVDSGTYVAQYAPDIADKEDKAVVYVVERPDHTYSVYSERDGLIIESAVAASKVLMQDRIPMLFKLGTETVYITPRDAKKHIIASKVDSICFEQNSLGQPTHNNVFVVRNGRPIVLNSEKHTRHSKCITRYDKYGTVENAGHAYLPLLLDREDSVISFLGSHRPQDYRDLASEYARLEGFNAVPEYLQAVTQHFTEIVSEGGKLTLERVIELKEQDHQASKDLDKKVAVYRAQMAKNNSRVAEINEELRSLGLSEETEESIRTYYPKNTQRAALARLRDSKGTRPDLYQEREELSRENASIGFDKIQPLNEEDDYIANHLYCLGLKEETLKLLTSIEALTATIAEQYTIPTQDTIANPEIDQEPITHEKPTQPVVDPVIENPNGSKQEDPTQV